MVATGGVLLLYLLSRWRDMSREGRGLFRRSRSSGGSAGAAVIASVVYRDVVDHGLLINIRDVRDAAYVVHRTVVEKCSVTPVPARIADTNVAEAIEDATVEADLWSPVAGIPDKGTIVPSPITRSPQQTNRRQGPCAGHPVIAVMAPSPVTGRPQITGTRTNRLLVHRQRWWSDRNSHGELCGRWGRQGQHHQGKQQRTTKQAHVTHLRSPPNPEFQDPCDSNAANLSKVSIRGLFTEISGFIELFRYVLGLNSHRAFIPCSQTAELLDRALASEL